MGLRSRGQPTARLRALLAITPAAASRLRSLPRFLRQVEDTGRHLAQLNIPPGEVLLELQNFDELLDRLVKHRFGPAREQLYLATNLVLESAFYQVREAEAQAFFGLFRAEAKAATLDDLLRGFMGVLVKVFHAAAGGVLFGEGIGRGKLAHPLYIRRGTPNEKLIGGEALRGRHASYWSYPFSPSAVMQLGFAGPRPWLPRELSLLGAAAALCREAIDRSRMEQEIRRLAAQSRCAEEEERRRIGRELHDEAGQSLLLLGLQLDMLGRDAPEILRPRLAEARDLAARTAVELRRIVTALGPAVLERLGLRAAIGQLAGRFRKLHRAELRVRAPVSGIRLPGQTEEVIYRVAQECLHNIAKHSQATRVNLSLRRVDKEIRLRVADNGAGFRADQVLAKPRSFGLTGMRERVALLGGSLVIRSAPGKGTAITLEVPMRAGPVIENGKNSRLLN